MKSLKYPLLLASALLLSLSACGGGDLEDALGISDPKVRFIDAVPSAPRLTFYRNDDARNDATNVTYLHASNYAGVDTGSARWRVREAGTATDLDSVSVDPDRGERYTFLALAPSSGTPPTASLLSIRDPYGRSPLPMPQMTRLRVVNGSPNVPALDVYLTTTDIDLDRVSPTLRDMGYREARPRSGDDSLTMASDQYRLRLTEHGSRDVRFEADVNLPSQGDYLLVTVPAPEGGSALRVLVVRVNSDDQAESTIELRSSH